MKTHFLIKFISTTSRYLFPHILKITLLFFKILAEAYCAFISFGLFHSAFEASRNHTNNCCSLSGFSSQKSRKVRLASTLKINVYYKDNNKITIAVTINGVVRYFFYIKPVPNLKTQTLNFKQNFL